ncbi:MAG: glycosyltransferase family 4 protein [Winogradskyella sp.]|uniref:glycosyltransferase family 4 protein n=1 Tax=Winogradskyella sp. TaxID=1883156 RepID=UPI0017E2ECE7|nr:glycosyltransferase family 4 protein [Winogradskyella sp.]
MKNVLYVGNALSNKGKTITTIESLGDKLKEICDIKIASRHSNKFLRMLDMITLVIINRSKADYVLIDTYSTSNYYYAIIISQLSRLLRLKYIPILHGGNLESRLKRNPNLSRLVFKYAHVLVAPSNYLKQTFESYGYNNIIHIPNFIELDYYPFINREIKDIRLLWVRSFSTIYNPELAIKVLEKLKEKRFKASLTMVGPEVDGSFSEVKKLAKKKGLNVEFTGQLSKQEWIALSKNHNIFINTTNIDNTPVSVIEAMALGLPIVSTNVGGLPFLINREEGILIEPNNVTAMVQAVLKLNNNQKFKDIIVSNARRKAETFDWHIIKQKWKSLL